MMKYTFIIGAFLLVSCQKNEENKSNESIQITDSSTIIVDTVKVDTVKVNTVKVIPIKKNKVSTKKDQSKEEIWVPDGRAPRLIICNEYGSCDTVIDLLP